MSVQLDSKRVQYTGMVRTAGGRTGGRSRSDDGRLDIGFSVPGKSGKGANPEQLLAAGWSACLHDAMRLAAMQMRVLMPADAAIDAEIDLCLADVGYGLQARFRFSLPGMSLDRAQALVDSAHRACSYSKAMRGSIPVELTLT